LTAETELSSRSKHPSSACTNSLPDDTTRYHHQDRAGRHEITQQNCIQRPITSSATEHWYATRDMKGADLEYRSLRSLQTAERKKTHRLVHSTFMYTHKTSDVSIPKPPNQSDSTPCIVFRSPSNPSSHHIISTPPKQTHNH
jgi:hypothetical protein